MQRGAAQYVDIGAVTLKASPVGTDELIIRDNAGSAQDGSDDSWIATRNSYASGSRGTHRACQEAYHKPAEVLRYCVNKLKTLHRQSD
jgi:hypothetical protein